MPAHMMALLRLRLACQRPRLKISLRQWSSGWCDVEFPSGMVLWGSEIFYLGRSHWNLKRQLGGCAKACNSLALGNAGTYNIVASLTLGVPTPEITNFASAIIQRMMCCGVSFGNGFVVKKIFYLWRSHWNLKRQLLGCAKACKSLAPGNAETYNIVASLTLGVPTTEIWSVSQ